MSAKIKQFIKVRTEFEGFHCYPDAGKIDPKISFLENMHRHIFKVSVKISVTHLDRELEFFLVKWNLNNFLKNQELNTHSCESIATIILNNFLLTTYGSSRDYIVVVSEDGESDGIIEYYHE